MCKVVYRLGSLALVELLVLEKETLSSVLSHWVAYSFSLAKSFVNYNPRSVLSTE